MAYVRLPSPDQIQKLKDEFREWLRRIPTWQLEMRLGTEVNECQAEHYRAELEAREEGSR